MIINNHYLQNMLLLIDNMTFLRSCVYSQDKCFNPVRYCSELEDGIPVTFCLANNQ